MSKKIWITWEKQRRNKGVSAGLGFDFHEIISTKKGIFRYVESLIKTIILVLECRPNVVAVQNPSIVLSLFMVMLKPLAGFYLIVDSHNAGISPLEGKNKILNNLAVFIQRTASLTLVTNIGLKKIVEGNKGRGFVLPDRLPDVENIGRFNFEQGKRVVFVCTFSDDEPYTQVFEAGKTLSDDIKIYVTGRYQGKVEKKNIPNNIRLLGFVPDDEYWAILFGSDAIIDLTTRENCLVCGAYEGIALNKPLILSDTQATKELFNEGCIFVKPVAEEIRLGILECLNKQQVLLEEICRLKKSMNKDWGLKIEQLKKMITLDTEK